MHNFESRLYLDFENWKKFPGLEQENRTIQGERGIAKLDEHTEEKALGVPNSISLQE